MLSQYFDTCISIFIPKHEVSWTINKHNVRILTLFKKLVSTELYTLTITRFFIFYKMHVQHMLRETDLTNQVKIIKT